MLKSATESDQMDLAPGLPADHAEELTPQEWVIVDQALAVVHADYLRVATRLRSPVAMAPNDLILLRQGPLGQDLMRLTLAARDGAGASPEQVRVAIERVVQLLFWPAVGENYQVPRAFWATALGQMLARARFGTVAPTNLVAIGVAAHWLAVARPTIYRWIDDRTLDSVRDEQTGRTFVLRQGVETLAALARVSPGHN